MNESTLNYPSIVEALVFQIQALKEEIKSIREFKPEAKRPLLHLCKPVDPVRSEMARTATVARNEKKRAIYFAVIDELERQGLKFEDICSKHGIDWEEGSKFLYSRAAYGLREWIEAPKSKEGSLIRDLENLTGIRICDDERKNQ